METRTNKIPKISIIYLGRTGGPPKTILELVKEIKKQNLTTNYSFLLSKDNLLLKEIEKYSQNIETLTTPTTSFQIFLKLPIFIYKSIKYLLKCKKDKIRDFFFIMTHPWNPLLMFLIKTFIRNSKIVYLVHDANPHPGESNSKLQRFISNLEIKSANHILAHSEEVSNILKSRYQDLSVTKIPHPTYDFGEITTPRAISPTPTFLFFGRIVEYKGLTLLLDSFLLAQEKLRSQGKTIKLIIAGNGEINYTNLKKIKDYQQDIELINRYIDEEEITDIWQRSDICSLTYVEASQSGVIAIAVNQAMPCLITPIAGLEEQTLIDNEDKSFALMSKDLDPENIAETMIDILDENTYTKLSLNAIKHQKDLGWNKWLEVLDKILKD